jgi:hypothetical protein
MLTRARRPRFIVLTYHQYKAVICNRIVRMGCVPIARPADHSARNGNWPWQCQAAWPRVAVLRPSEPMDLSIGVVRAGLFGGSAVGTT